MNYQMKFDRAFYFLAVMVTVLLSCKKENSGLSDASLTSTSDFIAVAAEVAAVSGAVTDSVYLVQPCSKGSSRDTIAQASLLSGITSYLETNYAGYTFHKAYSISDSQGTVTGYVAVVYYNDKPVGVQFDSSGNFVKTLEQREKGDLTGRGWHHGGRFGDRGGLQKDTVSLNSLPAVILSYLSANYSGDTLQKAFKNRDSSLLVLSSNNGLFATVFDAANSFVKRVQIPNKKGQCAGIEKSALPASLLAYLDSTYPNYVFKKAFTISSGGTLQGYLVIIDANNTKYALEFNSAGNFVNLKTIW